jgi:hypothetical protein
MRLTYGWYHAGHMSDAVVIFAQNVDKLRVPCYYTPYDGVKSPPLVCLARFGLTSAGLCIIGL